MKNYLRLPRIKLAFLPTPLVFLKNLSQHLGGPSIYMKRDDCTGLATGGNKTRKLEFLMADALQLKADTIITAGALQSNHARQTAAAAASLGFKCELLLTASRYRHDIFYENTGNILFNQIFGAHLHKVDADADISLEMTKIADKAKAQGHAPYLIPIGGSNALGAMAYVAAAEEIYQQCQAQHISPTHLVLACSSGGTQAGLLIGKQFLNWDIEIIAFTVGALKEVAQERVDTVIQSAYSLLNMKDKNLSEPLIFDDHYIGEGYGQPTAQTIAAIQLVAQTEGILLDPVYTGKAMAGLIDYIRQGNFNSRDSIIFLHTGGYNVLHAYAEEFKINAGLSEYDG